MYKEGECFLENSVSLSIWLEDLSIQRWDRIKFGKGPKLDTPASFHSAPSSVFSFCSYSKEIALFPYSLSLSLSLSCSTFSHTTVFHHSIHVVCVHGAYVCVWRGELFLFVDYIWYRPTFFTAAAVQYSGGRKRKRPCESIPSYILQGFSFSFFILHSSSDHILLIANVIFFPFSIPILCAFFTQLM